MDAPAFEVVALLRALGWCCLAALAGLTWIELCTPRDRVRPPGSVAAATVAAAALVLVRLGQLYAQTWAFFAPDEPVNLANLRLVAGSTAWGSGWSIQALAAIGLLLGAALAPRARAGWFLVAASGAVAVLAEPLTGHAGETGVWSWLWILQTLHVAASMVWVGGVGVLLLILLAGSPAPRAVRELVNRFSPLALVAGPAVVITGAASAWLSLASPSDLWRTEWGLALLLKLALVAAVAGLGAYNWRVVRPRLGADASSGELRRSVAAELAVMVLVLTVTAVLVALPLPTG